MTKNFILIRLATVLVILIAEYTAFGQDLPFEYGDADWSPDGKYIVYVSTESGSREMYTFEMSSRNRKQLTSNNAEERTPVWSPDNKSIAFVSNQEGNLGIYLYDFKTGDISSFIHSPYQDVTPAWSKDSKSIIYVQFNPANQRRSIHSIDLFGNDSEILPDSTRNFIYPNYSNDNLEIILATKRRAFDETFHVWKYDPIGGSGIQLENIGVVSYNPRWSQDGQEIVFVNQSQRDIKTATVYKMDSNGDNIIELVTCEDGCFQPRLSPDGKNVLFKSGWGKDNKGIYLYSLESHNSKLLIGN